MPQISATHLAANRAVLSVCTILDQAGALSETIKNDYGEDLLVQTQLNESADNFHVFIQVKSATQRTKHGLSVRINIDHMRRWILSSQQFLICAYDANSNTLYAQRPSKTFSIWELMTPNRKSLTLNFSDEDVVNSEKMKNLIWECRIDYFSKILSFRENSLQYSGSKHKKFLKIVQRDIDYITFYFLKCVGIIKDDEICQEFRRRFYNATRNFAAEHENDKLAFRGALMLCLISVIDDLSAYGAPLNLMEKGTDMCGHFFAHFHSEEWLSAAQLFPQNSWVPFGSSKQNRQARKPKPAV